MATSTSLQTGGVHLNGVALTDANGVSGAYPIGSIYLSVNNTSPASLFGGSWEKIKDKFLLSSGDTYSLGATGGEATHTLLVNEMPSHRHKAIHDDKDSELGNGFVTPATGTVNYVGAAGGSGWFSYSWVRFYTGYEGNGQPHNNMPPYLVVNVWKRIS